MSSSHLNQIHRMELHIVT